jgi:hypothetical protein
VHLDDYELTELVSLLEVTVLYHLLDYIVAEGIIH